MLTIASCDTNGSRATVSAAVLGLLRDIIDVVSIGAVRYYRPPDTAQGAESLPMAGLRAPEPRRKIWQQKGVLPGDIDRTIVEAVCAAASGVGDDCSRMLRHAFRVALAGGWGASASVCPPRETPLGALSSRGEDLGFSVEALRYALGGTFRATLDPLRDSILQNRISGIAGIICGADQDTRKLAFDLLERGVWVLSFGNGTLPDSCGQTSAASGGLKEVCEAFGLPPVLAAGDKRDSCRLLELSSHLIDECGLGDDLSSLPIVAVSPGHPDADTMAALCCLVASGIEVVAEEPVDPAYLHDGAREDFGACFHATGHDPAATAMRVAELLNIRREALGIGKTTQRKLFDMKDRRVAH